RIPGGLEERRLRHLEQEWQVEETEPNLLKMTHKMTGMVKYVDITDHHIDISKLVSSPSVQVIDLINVDTTLYNWKYTRRNMIPVGGFEGYPLVISELNNNNWIDVIGTYKIPINMDFLKVGIFELQVDTVFALKKIYTDTSLTIPIAITDVDKDSLKELNIKGGQEFIYQPPINFFKNYESSQPDSYPNVFNFSHIMWYALGTVGSETFTDLDNDGITDVLYLGDDTIPQPCYEIFVAEYDDSLNNFDRKFGMCSPGFYTSGFSVGDFDGDGFKEFDTGGLFGDVFVFENTGDDVYQLTFSDTISAPNAYLNASTNDMDGNGKPEFFIGGSSYYNGIPASRIYWFEASGNNTYQKVRSIFLLGTGVLGTTELYAYDVNGDGIQDLVFSFSSSVAMLIWNDASQQFDLFYYDYWENLNQEIQSVSMYDVFNSGKLELFVSVTDIAVIPRIKSYFYLNHSITGIKDIPPVGIKKFRLFQNFPNPFNGSTRISFYLPQRLPITLIIFDLTGKEVMRLINNQVYAPGEHSIKWDGRTNNGKEVSSGLYFYVLTSGGNREVKKLLFIK
ncbi:MAG: T9SS C-terminal target domain-containing protein, partial [Calditrichaeota bacterium]